jgi:hypothetical protein
LFSYFGRAGRALAYQPAVNKLVNDLGNLQSVLNRLLLLVKNPAFEEVLTNE